MAAAGYDALPLPAVVLDGGGRFARLNDAAEMWLHLSERSVTGLATDDPVLTGRLRVMPDLRPHISAALAGDAVAPFRAVFQISDRAGGWQMRRATIYLAPITSGGVVGVIRPDLPETLSDGLPGRGARAAIGMAEMLAHEIKNPLAGIRGAAQLLLDGLPPEDRDLAELIVAESRRIVALMEQVERFGDTTAPRAEPTNIHDVLDRARRSFELSGAGLATVTVTDYDPSLPPAMVDPDRIVQLVMNLLRNAAEALARDPAAPAVIRIRTAYDSTVRGEAGPLPLQVEIEDNGPGIPEAIADQIFEPFVSGRENGTGLGLALVGKIVTDHRALIRVDSRPGRTSFRLSLPKAPPVSNSAAKAALQGEC